MSNQGGDIIGKHAGGTAINIVFQTYQLVPPTLLGGRCVCKFRINLFRKIDTIEQKSRNKGEEDYHLREIGRNICIYFYTPFNISRLHCSLYNVM